MLRNTLQEQQKEPNNNYNKYNTGNKVPAVTDTGNVKEETLTSPKGDMEPMDLDLIEEDGPEPKEEKQDSPCKAVRIVILCLYVNCISYMT